ncbi:hypothetical protein BGZ76_009678 [Entomortierella beljakovae]|nr:hypothetical protein BGZ76_009678 [Entomortierella beljakovae]
MSPSPILQNEDTATPSCLSSFDPKKVSEFFSKYPDYCEEEQDLPLWIEGVDTTYAPFIPTSTRRVIIALEMANVNKNDKVLDVGSGDGRFCFASTALFGAQKAHGIEFEQDLVEKSTELAQEYVDQGKVSFQRGDLVNWRESSTMRSKEWSVIVVFLSPEGGTDMEEWLVEEFERGVRIVALVFDLKQLKGLHCSVEDSMEGIWVYEKQK